MPGKWPDQTLDQALGLPERLVAVSTSRLSCKRAGKTRTLMPDWDSSGESRLDWRGRVSGYERKSTTNRVSTSGCARGYSQLKGLGEEEKRRCNRVHELQG
jgi:hypothetical protein